MDETLFQSYLDKDLDQLYFEFGKKIDPQKNAFPKPKTQYITIGKKWIFDNYEVLREAVCSSKIRDMLIKEEDGVKAGIELANILASILSIIPIFALAAIIIKTGLKKFCQQD